MLKFTCYFLKIIIVSKLICDKKSQNRGKSGIKNLKISRDKKSQNLKISKVLVDAEKCGVGS